MPFKTDYVTVSNPRLDSNGFLKVNATIARVGVQEYYENGKIIREYRPPDEVEKSAITFVDKPITVDHPPELKVTANNTDKRLKGVVKDSFFVDGTVDANLLITHADAVQAAMSTHRQLSCGYECDYEETSGVWLDELGLAGEKGKEYPYDRIQRNIVGNHLALVRLGRAGAVASIRNDDVSIINSVIDTFTMTKTYILDSRSYQLDDPNDVDVLISKLEATIGEKTKLVSDSQSKLEELTASFTAKLDGLTAEKDALTIKLNELESQSETKTDESQEVKAKLIADQIQTWFEVLPVIKKDNADFVPDFKLSESEIKKLYLEKVAPDHKTKLDSASVDYINAFWDLMKPSSRKEDSTVPLKEALTKTDGYGGKKTMADMLAEKRKANFKSDLKGA